MKPFYAETMVAPYTRGLYLAVADTTKEAVAVLRAKHRLELDEPNTTFAITYYGDTWAGIGFSRAACTHDIIAHEIFHATHALMASTGDKFSPKHHEPYAYLCGWLTAWVYGELRKRKVRVR